MIALDAMYVSISILILFECMTNLHELKASENKSTKIEFVIHIYILALDETKK